MMKIELRPSIGHIEQIANEAFGIFANLTEEQQALTYLIFNDRRLHLASYLGPDDLVRDYVLMTSAN